jgi:hypothetical protein
VDTKSAEETTRKEENDPKDRSSKGQGRFNLNLPRNAARVLQRHVDEYHDFRISWFTKMPYKHGILRTGKALLCPSRLYRAANGPEKLCDGVGFE